MTGMLNMFSLLSSFDMVVSKAHMRVKLAMGNEFMDNLLCIQMLMDFIVEMMNLVA